MSVCRRVETHFQRFFAITAMLVLFIAQGAAAQDGDPLSLGAPYGGYDAASSRAVLSKDFAGVWQVVHTDNDGAALRGRAVVSGNGRKFH